MELDDYLVKHCKSVVGFDEHLLNTPFNDKRQTVRKNENLESDAEDDFELDDVSFI